MDKIKVSEPLALDGAYNVRDLGGYRTAAGKTTKYKKFLRADSLHNLTTEDQDMLYGYGVRTVIDVRSTAEAEKSADAIDRTKMEYLGYPLLDNVQSRFLQGELPEDMGEMYIELVESSKSVFADIFRG
jgi:protein-tyrosine phosphatase